MIIKCVVLSHIENHNIPNDKMMEMYNFTNKSVFNEVVNISKFSHYNKLLQNKDDSIIIIIPPADNTKETNIIIIKITSE